MRSVQSEMGTQSRGGGCREKGGGLSGRKRPSKLCSTESQQPTALKLAEGWTPNRTLNRVRLETPRPRSFHALKVMEKETFKPHFMHHVLQVPGPPPPARHIQASGAFGLFAGFVQVVILLGKHPPFASTPLDSCGGGWGYFRFRELLGGGVECSTAVFKGLLRSHLEGGLTPPPITAGGAWATHSSLLLFSKRDFYPSRL